MRYTEFRDRVEGALHETGLMFFHSDRAVETIDLADTARNWKVYVYRTPPPQADPFHVSAEIGFTWNPVESARAYTTEEDLLAALLGRRRRPLRTERRWTRIDLSLHANLPYGSTTSIPEAHMLGGWTASVTQQADSTFNDVVEKGRIVAVLGGHGDVEVHAQCRADGIVSLKGLSVSGFRIVHMPRVWDDPARRETEKDTYRELDELARTFRAVFDAWTERISVLATWIRYSPPSPGAKPAEPWFDDAADDDNDSGPETTH